MDHNDIPIIQQTGELYKTFHEYRKGIAKTDKFTIYERSESLIINIVELFLEAGYTKRDNKIPTLEKASVKLNTLRLLVRLMKETRTIDLRKYIKLQETIDDIGRQLGGWLRNIQT